jgi:serine/threonine protein kinase
VSSQARQHTERLYSDFRLGTVAKRSAGALFVRRTNLTIRKVPEKFIWHIFQSISLALRTLYKSKHDNEEQDADSADDVGYLGFLVHQDIKPNNIFLKDFDGDTYPQVVLGDFDAVKLADDIADRRLLGTEGYMAPVSTTNACIRSSFKDDILISSLFIGIL